MNGSHFRIGDEKLSVGKGQKRLPRAVIVLQAIGMQFLVSGLIALPQASVVYTVNSTDDDAVFSQCADRNSKCTLRAAIQAANDHGGEDRIQFNVPAGSVINLDSALPEITEALEIMGPGPENLTVRRNTGRDYRIFHVLTEGTVSFSGLTISNGQLVMTGDGPGIFKNGVGILNVTNCALVGNSCEGYGGGISAEGTTNIINTTITENSALSGGGIQNRQGTLSIVDSTISGNKAKYYGGAMLLAEGSNVITNSTISGNTAAYSAGAIYNSVRATTDINKCMISSNQVQNGDGGAIANGEPTGTVNIFSSTISGNFARNYGGGIFTKAGIVNCTNTTINDNRATYGGGIFNESEAQTNVSNSTITGNHADETGGGMSSSGSGNLKSTIIALNTGTGSKDVYGVYFSLGFNLVGLNAGAEPNFPAGNPNGNKDIVGTTASPINPQLDPNGLQDNGGPTSTIALLPGSPAIDQGTSNSLTGTLSTDQRGTGFSRTSDDAAVSNGMSSGDGTDIGAFELQTLPATTLANISTRLRVGIGDNALIGGFIVTGSQPKKVIIRAIGPSLGLAGQLANPTLELYTGQTLLGSNDNWVDSPDKQAIIDSTIPPANELESAIITTLPANGAGYTAVVRGVNNATGIGIVQIYDLDRSVDSKLANISTRGLVRTGDDVLIAGTIVLGPGPQKVIIRAIGPSLSVAGKMSDPTLELRNANGDLVRSNDNWRTGGQEAEIIQSTVPPPNDFESAIVETLSGNGSSYTAIVRGAGNTTGVAVVDVYAIN